MSVNVIRLGQASARVEFFSTSATFVVYLPRVAEFQQALRHLDIPECFAQVGNYYHFHIAISDLERA